MLKHPLPVQLDFFPCLGSGKFESCLGGVRIWTKSVRPFQQNTPVSSFKMEVFIGKACTFARTWLRRKGLLESQGSWSYLLQKDWPSNLEIWYSIWMKFLPRGYKQTSLQKFRCPGGRGGGGGEEEREEEEKNAKASNWLAHKRWLYIDPCVRQTCIMCSVLCSQVNYYLGGGGNVYIVPRGVQITHFCLAHIMDSWKKNYIFLYLSVVKLHHRWSWLTRKSISQCQW